ncbi:Protein GLB-22 a [Aphelenchoides avenae]|nr:Protein GLB-22 a [Aphelenchus avenae]
MIAGATAHLRYKKRGGTPGPKSGKQQGKGPGTPKKTLRNERRGSLSSLLPAASTSENKDEESSSIIFSEMQRLDVPPPCPTPFMECRKRAGSVPTVKYTLAVAWSLKSDQVRALKVTWERLCDTPRSNCRGILAIMERVMEKFELKEKRVKEVFYNSAFVDGMADCAERRRSENASIATLRDHIHFFVSLISQVIHSLEKCPQEILDHIDKIGSCHAHMKKYGFRMTMWDKLGVCLLDALVIQDCVRGYPDAACAVLCAS